MISLRTATDIALAYREIETAEKMLVDVERVTKDHDYKDVRDAFGRPRNALELGIPTGNSSKRLFQVQWSLARPVIEAHIASCRSQLYALMQKAKSELEHPSQMENE